MFIKNVIVNETLVPITFQVSHQMDIDDNDIITLFFSNLESWIGQYYAKQSKLRGSIIGKKFVLATSELFDFLARKIEKKYGGCVELLDITGHVKCKKHRKTQKAFFKVADCIISAKATTTVYYCSDSFSDSVHQKILADIGKTSHKWMTCCPYDCAVMEYNNPFSQDGCIVIMAKSDIDGIGRKINEIKVKQTFTLIAIVFPLIACMAGIIPCAFFCLFLLILHSFVGDRFFQFIVGCFWLVLLFIFYAMSLIINKLQLQYFLSLCTENPDSIGEGIIALLSGPLGLSTYRSYVSS